jgi:hypothetical protein
MQTPNTSAAEQTQVAQNAPTVAQNTPQTVSLEQYQKILAELEKAKAEKAALEVVAKTGTVARPIFVAKKRVSGKMENAEFRFKPAHKSVRDKSANIYPADGVIIVASGTGVKEIVEKFPVLNLLTQETAKELLQHLVNIDAVSIEEATE